MKYNRTMTKKAKKQDINANAILQYFRPSIYVPHFSSVPIDSLKEHGIKMVISDLDNTLVPHFTRFPNNQAKKFITDLKEAGFIVGIVSNNAKKRVDNFAKKVPEIDFSLSSAMKPFPNKIKKQLKKYKVDPTEVVIIGDQLIMDTLVANIIGCDSILVNPLGFSSNLAQRFINYLERGMYSRLSRENILHKEEYDSSIAGDKYEIT